MAKRILSLDIGAANVALAEYAVGAKGALTLVNYGVSPLGAALDAGDVETVLVPAILAIVREKGIKPGPVALSVSGQMVFPRFAAIAKAGGDEKFEQLIRYEIEQNVPFPFDEMVCDRQILGDTEAGDKNVLIVAAKLDQIEPITAAVTAAGFAPTLVDVAPIALTSALRVAEGDDGCRVLLDIGAKTTSLVIVEGERMYNRSIPIGGNNISREIASVLGCTLEEAEQIKLEKGYVSLGGVVEDEDEVADRVAKVCRAVLTRLQAEISRSVNFYRSQQGGAAPTKVYLAGGTSRLPQIDQFFADALQVEVVPFDPFAAVGCSPALEAEALGADAAFLGATVGTALHAVGRAPYAINLVPPSILRQKAEKSKVVVTGFGVLLIIAACVVALLATKNTTAVINGQLESVSAKSNALKDLDRRIKTATDEVAAAQAEADRFAALLDRRGAALAHFAALRRAIPECLWITQYDGTHVTLRGWKDRIAACVAAETAESAKKRTIAEIVGDRVKGQPIVDPAGVKVVDMSTVGRSGEVEQFTMEVKFK